MGFYDPDHPITAPPDSNLGDYPITAFPEPVTVPPDVSHLVGMVDTQGDYPLVGVTYAFKIRVVTANGEPHPNPETTLQFTLNGTVFSTLVVPAGGASDQFTDLLPDADIDFGLNTVEIDGGAVFDGPYLFAQVNITTELWFSFNDSPFASAGPLTVAFAINRFGSTFLEDGGFFV